MVKCPPFLVDHFWSLRQSFLPLDIQTPKLRRYLDPQNLPKAPSQEVLGCLGFNSNNHSPSRKKSQAQPKSPQEIGHQKLVLIVGIKHFPFLKSQGRTKIACPISKQKNLLFSKSQNHQNTLRQRLRFFQEKKTIRISTSKNSAHTTSISPPKKKTQLTSVSLNFMTLFVGSSKGLCHFVRPAGFFLFGRQLFVPENNKEHIQCGLPGGVFNWIFVSKNHEKSKKNRKHKLKSTYSSRFCFSTKDRSKKTAGPACDAEDFGQ